MCEQSSTDMASVISFFIGRYVARGWAEREIEKRPKFKAVDVAVEKQGMWIIILVRFSPVFPFGLWYGHDRPSPYAVMCRELTVTFPMQ